MAEKYPDCSVGSKINTLENFLIQFDMYSLLEELDISLEQVRRHKSTLKDHLDILKVFDKNLLKLIYHADAATRDKKSDLEIANCQNLQVALNATRTVLKALTKAFLEDIDIHYSYELFAKMDIISLISEKEMDRQINNVLCKISLLSEVKRVNIVGEIRKFLHESRKRLESFQEVNKDEFERHRDYALHHLHKCTEGYKTLVSECELIVKERGGEHGEMSWNAIKKISDKSRRELEILLDLERAARKSIDGSLEIFSINEPVNRYDSYLISPFVLYINVMMICNTVINRKMGFWTKLRNYIIYFPKHINSPFNVISALFRKAYYFPSHLDKKSEYEREVEIILRRMNLAITTGNIIEEMKRAVRNIAEILAGEFEINDYAEGKSNYELFTEKLSKLNESVMEYKETEKRLQETLNLCKKENNEIREEYIEFSQKVHETEVE